MKKEKVILACFVLAFAMSLYFMFFAPRKNAQTPPPDAITAPPPVPQEGPAKAVPPPPVPSSPKSSQIEPEKDAQALEDHRRFEKEVRQLSLASAERMRNEVIRNPHVTPPSVLASGERIRGIYKKVKNIAQAEKLMEALDKCSNVSSPTAAQVQIICLNYARRLGGDYPSLNPVYVAMEEQSTDQVREIHSVIKELRK
jgi:hypothetical protein